MRIKKQIHRKILLSEKNKILSLYQDGYDCQKIGNIVGRDRGVVRRFLKNNGIKIRNKFFRRTYTINENFFETIDNPEKAYFLGWLSADGAVTKNNNIKLGLQGKDGYIVENFNKAIGSNRLVKTSYYNIVNHPLWQGKTNVNIVNRKMCQDLAIWGCIPNKSVLLKFPHALNSNDFLRFYLRGFFEGNGCLSFNPKTSASRIAICSTQDFCEGLSNLLKSVLDIQSSTRKCGGCWRVDISRKKSIIKFLNWIYNSRENMVLYRKYSKFLEFKKLYFKEEINCT